MYSLYILHWVLFDVTYAALSLFDLLAGPAAVDMSVNSNFCGAMHLHA